MEITVNPDAGFFADVYDPEVAQTMLFLCTLALIATLAAVPSGGLSLGTVAPAITMAESKLTFINNIN